MRLGTQELRDLIKAPAAYRILICLHPLLPPVPTKKVCKIHKTFHSFACADLNCKALDRGRTAARMTGRLIIMRNGNECPLDGIKAFGRCLPPSALILVPSR